MQEATSTVHRLIHEIEQIESNSSYIFHVAAGGGSVVVVSGPSLSTCEQSTVLNVQF